MKKKSGGKPPLFFVTRTFADYFSTPKTNTVCVL
jgi:hypothetical protein